jgi:hypothetical protein
MLLDTDAPATVIRTVDLDRVHGGVTAAELLDRSSYIQDGAQAGTVPLSEIRDYNRALDDFAKRNPKALHEELAYRRALSMLD